MHLLTHCLLPIKKKNLVLESLTFPSLCYQLLISCHFDADSNLVPFLFPISTCNVGLPGTCFFTISVFFFNLCDQLMVVGSVQHHFFFSYPLTLICS